MLTKTFLNYSLLAVLALNVAIQVWLNYSVDKLEYVIKHKQTELYEARTKYEQLKHEADIKKIPIGVVDNSAIKHQENSAIKHDLKKTDTAKIDTKELSKSSQTTPETEKGSNSVNADEVEKSTDLNDTRYYIYTGSKPVLNDSYYQFRDIKIKLEIYKGNVTKADVSFTKIDAKQKIRRIAFILNEDQIKDGKISVYFKRNLSVMDSDDINNLNINPQSNPKSTVAAFGGIFGNNVITGTLGWFEFEGSAPSQIKIDFELSLAN